ncbi:ATP-dependent DNA helicase Q-like 5 isoform X2 [Telopea speciosissima]|uniref:ATP-dependent DNA helicase Q-like 5 isoform X2 n=1 Tax=Telopea speciosissima TaxID=54955 RepID=UPI001CC5545A|nr:ATP-dependent DNA helicase Q-like 5 isoform X2 [Telopea speciosissima]
METDSDSEGSHVSATPPRDPTPPQQPPPVLLSSKKVRVEVTASSRSNNTSKPKHVSKQKPLKSKIEIKTKPSKEDPPPYLIPSADFSILPGSLVKIHNRSHGISTHSSVENLLQGCLPSKFASFSKIRRPFFAVASTEENTMQHSPSIPQPQSIVGSDCVEGEQTFAGSVSLETSSRAVHVSHHNKSMGKLPNLIRHNVNQLPAKRPKSTGEGNFVRLNINGYGRKFTNKWAKKRNSSSSRFRKSYRRSKGKPKTEGEADTVGCDENGLVSEIPKQEEQCRNSKFSHESIEQAVLDARDEPSDENLMKLLKLTHGYESFREGQLEAIKQVLAGRSVMLVLPTGFGKSLCYQLPALILPGITLVVSPLVALMVDQLRQLPPMIRGALLCSNQTSEEASITLQQLREGAIKVLFVSPERFLNAEFLSMFEATPPVSLVVIDEAHCLSEWSHNFRPSYLRLKASLLRAKLNVDCILAMTATATTKTLHVVMCSLEIPATNLIQTSHIRENLQLSVTLSANRSKDLLMLMKSSPLAEVRSIIIYCKFQFETDTLSKYLCDNNISAKSYHSGIPAKVRSRTQELFCSNKIRVVVATVAFGMGLNKSDVGAVIHYSLPESLEEYVQGVLDGMGGCPIVIFFLMSQLISGFVVFYTDEYAVNRLLCQIFSNDMNSHGKICSIVKEAASRKLDMKEEVILTVLTYLEVGEMQHIGLLPQLNVACTLYFHKTSPELLAGKDILVATILKKSEIKQGNYTFDIPSVANSIGITAVDVSNWLQNLKSKGEITYETKEPGFCYTIVKRPEDFCSLATHVTRWLSEVENCKVRKLDTMFNAATFAAKACTKIDGCSGSQHTRCFQKKILDYFTRDENTPSCELPTKMDHSSPFLQADIKVFLQNNSHVKFTPRAVARIMHGIGSPAYPSTIWSKTHFWGRYSQTDFPVIMQAAMTELMKSAGKEVS